MTLEGVDCLELTEHEKLKLSYLKSARCVNATWSLMGAIGLICWLFIAADPLWQTCGGLSLLFFLISCLNEYKIMQLELKYDFCAGTGF